MRHLSILRMVGMLVLLVGFTQAVQGQAPKAAAKPAAKPAAKTDVDPPGTAQLMATMRGFFVKYDTNKDNFLDEAEVHRAFGLTPPKASETTSMAKKDDEETKSESDKDKKTAPASTAPRKLNRAEQFLASLDKDGDGKISKEEYEEWAHDYCREMAQKQDDLHKMADAQRTAQMLQMANMQASLQRRQQQNQQRNNRNYNTRYNPNQRPPQRGPVRPQPAPGIARTGN